MGLSCKSQTAIAVRNSAQDPGRSGVLESFRFRELEVATGSFALESLILKASHGHLYRAALHDGRMVAVKRPDSTGARAQEDADAFNNEVQILSKLFSRRLVNLLGCSYDGRERLLVLEHMENGTLHEKLTASASAAAAAPLSWNLRAKLALDVAKAVRALHASSPPIIHRNLRTTNVFIDRDGNARLGDFCLGKCLHETEPPRRSALISIPEIVTESEPGRHSLEDFDSSSSSGSNQGGSPKTDVFSFGILLLEIISGRSSHDADHHVATLRLLDWALPLIKHGHAIAICDPRIAPLPDVTASVQLIASIAARCVRSSSKRRPSMEEVVQCLTKASKLHTEDRSSSSSRAQALPGTPTIQERLIDSTPTKLTVRSSVWTVFTRLKKKRTLVFRLSRFLARKFRLGSRYGKLPVHPKNGNIPTPLKGAKVSDEGLRERSVVEHVLQHKKSVLSNNRESHKILRPPTSTTFAGPSSHRSGKKFVRL